MKKIIFCLIIFINTTGLFPQDFSVFHGERLRNDDLDRILRFYYDSIFEFSNIFSSKALRILLGEVNILDSRWVELDIFSLSQLDNRSLRLLRNMIYARHGYKFNSPDLTSYFNRFDWYNPRYDNVDNLLTNVDRYHIQFIQAYENRNENIQNIFLNNPIGFWHDSPAVAADYGERFIFHLNNRLEFYFSSMQNMPIVTRLNGSYTISGNVLIYSVTEINIIINNADIKMYPGGWYSWGSSEKNKLTLENPIVYRFPVSNIITKIFGSDRSLETITIGGREFFKFSDNVNY